MVIQFLEPDACCAMQNLLSLLCFCYHGVCPVEYIYQVEYFLCYETVFFVSLVDFGAVCLEDWQLSTFV